MQKDIRPPIFFGVFFGCICVVVVLLLMSPRFFWFGIGRIRSWSPRGSLGLRRCWIIDKPLLTPDEVIGRCFGI